MRIDDQGGIYFSSEDLKACGSKGLAIRTLIGFAVRGGWGGQEKHKKIRKLLFERQRGLSAISDIHLDLNDPNTTIDHIFSVADAVRGIMGGADLKSMVEKLWSIDNLRLITRAENTARNKKTLNDPQKTSTLKIDGLVDQWINKQGGI